MILIYIHGWWLCFWKMSHVCSLMCKCLYMVLRYFSGLVMLNLWLDSWLASPVSLPEFAVQRPQSPATAELAHRSRPGLQFRHKSSPRWSWSSSPSFPGLERWRARRNWGRTAVNRPRPHCEVLFVSKGIYANQGHFWEAWETSRGLFKS
jgi:hypothetical protein